MRGLGGFVRSSWDEVNEIVAAANVYTIKQHGPDRVIGFSPIPAMSMVSYAAGSRYLSLIGGVCMSFYDWYCDLPPSSPQVWGEQTDVPESADWYNSSFIIAWGSNVPQTRTPDAHFFTEVRYKGAKTVAVTPDYSRGGQARRHLDASQAGHRRRAGDGDGPRDPEGVLLPRRRPQRSAYFDDYVRRYTDMPMLVLLKEHALPGGEVIMVPDRYVRASDFDGKLGQANNPEWKTVAFDDARARSCCRNGAIGFRWGADGRADSGKWNLEAKEARNGQRRAAQAVAARRRAPAHETATGRLPVLRRHRERAFPEQRSEGRRAGAHGAGAAHRAGQGRRTREALVATVFDLQVANYGVDRGLPASWRARASTTTRPTRRPGRRRITGVPRDAGDHGRAPVRRQRATRRTASRW